MKPLLFTGLLLLGLTLVLALVGTILARTNRVRRSNASRYTIACTVLVLAVTYALTRSAWATLHLQTLDFWSLMVIVAIASHSTVWAAVAHQLNKPQFQRDYGDSVMLSMLNADHADHADHSDQAQHPDAHNS